ncbi:MAG: VOC family protein [Pseudomonadota bacterium]
MRFQHINLAVRDPEVSANFYKTYLMPGAETVWLGASLHLRDARGSDMAFQAAAATGDIIKPEAHGAHHGFLAASAAEIDSLAARLTAEGVDLVEDDTEAGFRAIKFADPDGYVCEVYWEGNWPPDADS